MTLTLTLSPDRETWLQAQARTAGVTPEEYALRVLDDAATHQALQTPEQKAAGFLEWSRGQNVDAPPLPLEATSREALYADDEALYAADPVDDEDEGPEVERAA